MRRLVSAALFCLALPCVWSFAAHGESVTSGNRLLPYCKRAMDEPSMATNVDDALNIGFCLGLAHAFLNLGDDLWPSAHLCPPQNALVNRTLRVAVHYMEAHPERLHEPIAELFIEALQQAWPCKE